MPKFSPQSALAVLMLVVTLVAGGAWGLDQAGVISLSDLLQNFGTSPSEPQEVAQEESATSTPNPEADAVAPVEAQPAQEVEVSSDGEKSTAAQIRERGVLRVGVRNDAEPFGFIDQAGNHVGFDLDIARELANRWLGDPSKVEFIVVNAANRVPKLMNGEVDFMLAAMSHNRERDDLVDFSQTNLVQGFSLAVPTTMAVNSLRGLQGKKIGVLADSVAQEVLQNAIAQNKLTIDVLPFASEDALFEAIIAQEIDAIGDNKEEMEVSLEARTDIELRIVDEPFAIEPFAIVVRQNDSLLRNLINFTLQDMKKEGVYDEIFIRWDDDDKPVVFEQSLGNWKYTFEKLPDTSSLASQSRKDIVLTRKKLIAGVIGDVPPFVQQNKDGALTGFDVALLEELSHYWFNSHEGVELVTAPLDELLAKMANGEIDMVLSGLVQQRQLAESVDFSQPYLGPPTVPNPISILLPQNDSLYRDFVNHTIQTMAMDNAYEYVFVDHFGRGISKYTIETFAGAGQAAELGASSANIVEEHGTVAETFVESAIARIRNRGNLLVAGVRTDLKPFGFVNDEGQVSGFDIDLLNEIATTWGISITFVPVHQNDASAILLSGGVDLAASATPINRKELVDIDFSHSYFAGGTSLMVRRYAGVVGIADLEGGTIGVIQGSPTGDAVLAHAERNKVQVNLVPFNEFSAMVEALKAGQVDAVADDRAFLDEAVKENSDMAVVGGTFTNDTFGFILPPGDSFFKNLLDVTLQDLKQNGVYDEIYKKWFGEEATPFAIEITPGTWPYRFVDSPTTLDTPVQSKVEEVLLNGRMVVGAKYDSKPFGFLNENNELAGFDIDLVREFAVRWFGDADAVQFVQVTPANRTEKLLAGEIDMIAASLTSTREREEQMDLSQNYAADSISFLVRSNSEITNAAGLDGRAIAVVQKSVGETYTPRIASEAGITFTLVPFQEYPQAIEALKAGQVEGVLALRTLLASFAEDNPGLFLTNEEFVHLPNVFGVPNYDKRFRDLVNFTLQQLKADGTYDRLYTKWFGVATPIYPVEIWDGESYFSNVNMTPMRRIAASEFTRGFDKGFPDEGPVQNIYLDTYWFDQYEVTNRDYAKCVKAGRCNEPSIPRSVNFANFYGESEFGNFPVIWVTWQDAATYCAYVGKRLPTEAEWEKAARGSEGSLYPWGDDEPAEQANYNYLEKDVSAIGKYANDVSDYGVQDMAGNVREWVADWYTWDYYQKAPDRNPAGPRNSATKVLRGGAWNDTAAQLRMSIRKNFLRESFDSNLGFRCASSTFPPSSQQIASRE